MHQAYLFIFEQITLTPAQMQALQLQVQGKTPGQPVIIQTTQAGGTAVQSTEQQAAQFTQVDTQVGHSNLRGRLFI